MTPGTNSAVAVWKATGHVQIINLLLEVEIRSSPVAQLTAAHSAPAQIAGLVNLIKQSLVALREVPYPTERRLVAPACLDQI